MAWVDGSGTASGVASALGSGTLRYGAGGATSGLTALLAAAVLFVGGSGHILGTSTGSATANLVGVLAGTASGSSTVIGDYRVNASGTASGVGTMTATVSVLRGGVGIAAGSSTVTGSGGVVYISTGQIGGLGELLWDNFVDSDGSISGLATVTGYGRRILWARGWIFGSSRMTFSYPLPIYGKGTLTGSPVVDRVPLAIYAIVAPSKCFRYLQTFQRGDLPIYISNPAGAVSPVRVAYTLYQVRPDGSRRQVGPLNRTPVQGIVGEFYATGRAGESGQPGEWVIRWEFQRTFQSEVQTKEMSFRVLDAVLAADPRDSLVRCRKYGWN